MVKMVKIILPTMAAHRSDVELMLGLLERTVKGEHDIGLEIIGKPEHFMEERHLDQIRENMQRVPNEVYRVVHGFSGIAVYEKGFGDMRTQDGREHLEKLIQLGDDIGAYYVHIHSGAGYRGERQSFEEKELEKVRKTLIECTEIDSGCEMGIENLPNPSMGDYPYSPKDIWRDYVDSMIDILYIVANTDIKVTLDTAHYAANMIGKEIDLVSVADLLGRYLGHIHANDVSGLWVPNESAWREGVVPGDGNIGKKSFERFFRYIIQKHPDIGINVEVHNTDTKNPVESEESIKRVRNWLKG